MAKKQKPPRQFSVEFKQQAVQRMQSGVSTTALAKELGIRRKLLYKWRDRVVAGKTDRRTVRAAAEGQRATPKRRTRLQRAVDRGIGTEDRQAAVDH